MAIIRIGIDPNIHLGPLRVVSSVSSAVADLAQGTAPEPREMYGWR